MPGNRTNARHLIAVHDRDRKSDRVTPGRFYRPLVEEPALFREFADLAGPLTEETVLSLANRYGALGDDDELEPTTAGAGETLELWSVEYAAMQEMVELADALVVDDEERLSAFARGLRSNRGARLRVDARLGDDLVQLGDPEDTDTIRVRVHASIGSVVDWRLAIVVESRLELSQTGDTAQLVHRPRHLLGVLWRQLAVPVAEGRTYRRCEGCGEWMDTSPAAGRVDRRYCSNACRMRAYRQRQDRARELAAQGATITAIAAELNSDEATVQAWMAV